MFEESYVSFKGGILKICYIKIYWAKIKQNQWILLVKIKLNKLDNVYYFFSYSNFMIIILLLFIYSLTGESDNIYPINENI